MKYFVILFILLIMPATMIQEGNGILVPRPAEQLYDDSKSIFVGTIIESTQITYDSDITDNNQTYSIDEYTVEVEQYFKNPLSENIIKVKQPVQNGKPIGGFNVGDDVLFYLEENNVYAPESCLLPSECTVGQMSHVTATDDVVINRSMSGMNVLIIVSISSIACLVGVIIWRKRK